CACATFARAVRRECGRRESCQAALLERLQMPNPKLQRSVKLQTRKQIREGTRSVNEWPLIARPSFEIWGLRFLWDLEFGVWSFNWPPFRSPAAPRWEWTRNRKKSARPAFWRNGRSTARKLRLSNRAI